MDIRNDVCPITFVKTRLLIEKMSVGDVATVILRGEEPIENVPASVVELGHTVLELTPIRFETEISACGAYNAGDMLLQFRKE